MEHDSADKEYKEEAHYFINNINMHTMNNIKIADIVIQ